MRAQVVKMVSHGGGANNINAVKEHLGTLQACGFVPDQVVKMVSCAGGSHNLIAAKDTAKVLGEHGFTVQQIVQMVAHDGGSRSLVRVFAVGTREGLRHGARRSSRTRPPPPRHADEILEP